MTDMQWYNYKTESYELRETPEDFEAYIPQSGPAQNMYKLLIELGETPIEAALQVLTASVKGGGNRD